MRLIRFAQIALEAEGLRLRHQAHRAAIRALLIYFAVILVFTALCFGHLAAWFWLRETWTPTQAAFWLMGADLLLAALTAAIAIRSTPGAVEREALAVRKRAMEDVSASLTATSLLIRALELLMSSRGKS